VLHGVAEEGMTWEKKMGIGLFVRLKLAMHLIQQSICIKSIIFS
jgi:hypothetical protein